MIPERSPLGVPFGPTALLLAALLVVSTVAGVAAAEPRVFIVGTDAESDEVLAGDELNVSVTLKNTGSDSGAIDLKIKRNGTTVAEDRPVVESEEEKTVEFTVRFPEHGTYVLKANGEHIRTVEVRRAVASTTVADAELRTVDVRARSAPTGEPYPIQFPASTNRSLAIERWTVEASSESFTQSVTEYTDASASGIELPQGPTAAVVGVITVGSTDEVDAVTMRIAVQRDALRSAGVATEDLTVYHRNGSRWEPLRTNVSDERTEQVVYEVRATSFSTFAVGSFEPQFSIDSTGLSTSGAERGQRIALTATINNTGSVAGDYEATMLVDDDSVNETTVSVPAGETRTVSLTHTVTDAGTYEVAIGDQDAGSVLITEGQVTTATGSPTTGPTVTATATSPETAGPGSGTGDGGPLASVRGALGQATGALPPTVLGIETLYVVGGVGGGLVLFLGIAALLRRRGGDEPPSSFDDW